MTTAEFDPLYTTYRQYVRSIISRRTPAADVQDLEQTVWLHVFEHISDIPIDLKPWLANTARTICRDYHRHREQTVSLDAPLPGSDDDMTLASTLADETESSIDPDQIDALRDSVDRLPRRTAEIMVMHYYDGHSIADIALILGISAGTVKWHLGTGRDMLRRQFDSEAEKKIA